MGNAIARPVTVSEATEPVFGGKPVKDADVKEAVPRSPLKVIIVNAPGKIGSHDIPSESSLAETTPATITENDSLVSGLSDEIHRDSFIVTQYDGAKHYSDFILDGLSYRKQENKNIVMLFESPSSCSHDSSFFNGQVYKFHDYPPPKTLVSKCVLGPCRYSACSGDTYPIYLRDPVPSGLVDHWKKYVPGFVEPTFVPKITDDQTVYAYLPVEHIQKHVNDPHVHYHLAGKDVLRLMTTKTTKLLSNTQDQRPCVCKTTHSMGSKGIFVIRNDHDEEEFNKFLAESGNPTYVITQFVEIARNVACHFFIHPSGEVTWFGSNENRRTSDGGWSPDSTILIEDQDHLRNIQLPFVEDVARYCRSLDFWGFCGVDVLFDSKGKGYLVDVNPRVTGSCPAIIMSRRFHDKYGFKYCLFRRNGSYAYIGTSTALLKEVDEYNEQHEGQSCVILNSFADVEPLEDGLPRTMLNIGVYSAHSLDECQRVLDHFAPLRKPVTSTHF